MPNGFSKDFNFYAILAFKELKHKDYICVFQKYELALYFVIHYLEN